jgi:hypothetical protein
MRSITDAFHPARRWVLLLALAEFTVLVLVFYAAAGLRFLGDTELLSRAFGEILPRALLFSSVHVLAMTALGMYISQSREGLSGHIVRAAVAFLAGGLFLIALQYALPVSPIGRGVMFIAMLLGLASIMLTRYFALKSVGVEALRRRVLVLGVGEKAALIATRLRRLSGRRRRDSAGAPAGPRARPAGPGARARHRRDRDRGGRTPRHPAHGCADPGSPARPGRHRGRHLLRARERQDQDERAQPVLAGVLARLRRRRPAGGQQARS